MCWHKLDQCYLGKCSVKTNHYKSVTVNVFEWQSHCVGKADQIHFLTQSLCFHVGSVVGYSSVLDRWDRPCVIQALCGPWR